ncbi:MAG: site-2 protease family protein [Clostridia bacterium]|nr:site-2 protease family protein [Clostridia bacterium]
MTALSLCASFLSVLTTFGYIVLALVVLLLMITIHEFGHYTFGKWLGFKINEFSIGFGKAIYSKKKKNGEVFSIRLIPLGGYCAFAGEDENDSDPNAFNNKHPFKRIIVLLGGVTFNFLSAIIFSFVLLISFGYDIPKVNNCEQNIEYVNEYNLSKLDEEKLDAFQNGDIIRKIDGKNISFITGNTFSKLVSNYKIDDVFSVTVQRAGEKEWVTLKMTKFKSSESDTVGVLGINTTAYRYTFFEALRDCVPLTFAMAWQVLVFLFMLITGGVSLTDIGGPLTTISVMADYSQQNIANLFVFLPFIAANLAVFNILPIPSLDGARIVFVLIEWIRRKPINRTVEGYIHLGGLVVLFAFIIFVDVFNLIR